MNTTYFIKVLAQHKKYILALTLIAILTTFVLLSFKKEKYKSLAQYSTGFTTERVKLNEGYSSVDIYNADVKSNNAIETFKSPKVTGMLSYNLLLHDLDNPQNAYRKVTDQDKVKALNINV